MLIRDSAIKPGENRKLELPYKDPYLMAKILNKNKYIIRDIPRLNIRNQTILVQELVAGLNQVLD